MPDLLAQPRDLAERIGADLDGSDPRFVRALEDASAFIRSKTGRAFTPTTETAELRGTDASALQLPRTPVQSVDTIEVRVEGLQDFTEIDDFVWDRFGRVVRGTGGGWPAGTWPGCDFWGGALGSVRVTYTHGTEEIPPDVKAIALSIAERLLASANRYSDASYVADAQNVVLAPTEFEAGVIEKWRVR